MTPAQEHEEHVARVLGLGFVETAQAAGDPPVTVLASRQHHSEATDALVVEALQCALEVLHARHAAAYGSGPHACETCRAMAKMEVALRALGK